MRIQPFTEIETQDAVATSLKMFFETLYYLYNSMVIADLWDTV